MKLHYFQSRLQAGSFISEYLLKYRHEECTVLAVSPGGLVVGAEIARNLHAPITMLLLRDVVLPDGRTVYGEINELGGFTYNGAFSAGELEEFEQEYRNNFESAKINAYHEMHMVLGQGGVLPRRAFRHKNVIVVNDMAVNGMAFDAAADFLKPIKTKNVIMCAPVASVKATDRMHILANEIVCLSVTAQDFPADHFFENNIIPLPADLIKIINTNTLYWHDQPTQTQVSNVT